MTRTDPQGRHGSLNSRRKGKLGVSLLAAVLLHERTHGIGHFSTEIQPLLHFVSINLDVGRADLRIVITKEVQRTAITTAGRVSSHNTEEGTLLVAHAGESQLNGHWNSPVGIINVIFKNKEDALRPVRLGPETRHQPFGRGITDRVPTRPAKQK